MPNPITTKALDGIAEVVCGTEVLVAIGRVSFQPQHKEGRCFQRRILIILSGNVDAFPATL
jgi:hypothetical protein